MRSSFGLPQSPISCLPRASITIRDDTDLTPVPSAPDQTTCGRCTAAPIAFRPPAHDICSTPFAAHVTPKTRKAIPALSLPERACRAPANRGNPHRWPRCKRSDLPHVETTKIEPRSPQAEKRKSEDERLQPVAQDRRQQRLRPAQEIDRPGCTAEPPLPDATMPTGVGMARSASRAAPPPAPGDHPQKSSSPPVPAPA